MSRRQTSNDPLIASQLWGSKHRVVIVFFVRTELTPPHACVAWQQLLLYVRDIFVLVCVRLFVSIC